MIQELNSMFIYPQIISDATGEVIENTYEYFGPDYLEASMGYGPDSQHAKKLFDLVTKLDNFSEIPVEYSDNLSEKLNSLRNFLMDLLTVQISHTSEFSYECLLSTLVPDPDGNKSLSITAIKYGDYLYLNFMLRNSLRNYEINKDFLHELESDLIDTQDRRSIEFPYILSGIFPSYGQIITIWSPREI